MTDLIDAILKGVKTSSFFYSKYYGAIEYRPITIKENENCYANALVGHSEKAVEFLTKHKFPHEEDAAATVETALEISIILDELDKWIIYHAAKDFQPPRWRQLEKGIPLGIHAMSEDSCCLEINKFADAVVELSECPDGKMESFLKTENGKTIGIATWRLDIPIIQELGDLTSLQLTFMVHSLDKYNGEWKDAGHSTIESAMKELNFKPNFQMDRDQLDLMARLDKAKTSKGERK